MHWLYLLLKKYLSCTVLCYVCTCIFQCLSYILYIWQTICPTVSIPLPACSSTRLTVQSPINKPVLPSLYLPLPVPDYKPVSAPVLQSFYTCPFQNLSFNLYTFYYTCPMAFQYLSLTEPVLQSFNSPMPWIVVPVCSSTCPSLHTSFSRHAPWSFSTPVPWSFTTYLLQYMSYSLYTFQYTCPMVFHNLPAPVHVQQPIHLSIHLSHGLSLPTCSSTCPSIYTPFNTPVPWSFTTYLLQYLSIAYTPFGQPEPRSFSTCLF